MRKRNIVLPARSIAYIMNQDKTEGGLLIGGNAGTTPEEVFAASMEFFLSKISNLLYNLIKYTLKKEEIIMQFIVKAYDGDGMLDKRMAVRPRHLEGMKKLGRQIICAGGLLDEEGKMKGSALIVEFEDRDALDAYLASEPYVTSGVWQKIVVEPMNVVLVNGEKI